MATLKYTMDTQDSTIVSWQRQMARHIRLSCSGIRRGLSLRRPIFYFSFYGFWLIKFSLSRFVSFPFLLFFNNFSRGFI